MKLLNSSFKLPVSRLKFINRQHLYPWLWIVPLSILFGLAIWVKFSKPATLANQWESPESVSNLADTNLVIDTYIKLSDRDSWSSVARQMTATKVGALIVYKFNSPDTCGFGGCLYVMSDGYARSRPLQLWDSPYFEASSKQECLRVGQKQQKYEICL